VKASSDEIAGHVSVDFIPVAWAVLGLKTWRVVINVNHVLAILTISALLVKGVNY
jgi:hypothetical protein